MRWPLSVSPAVSGAPLDLATIRAREAALAAPAHCTREQIAARVAACRACPDSSAGSPTCAACDLRCAHPAAQPGHQLLASVGSICPRNLWPEISA